MPQEATTGSFPSLLDVTRLSSKQMVIIPLAFLLFSASILAWNAARTGTLFNYGIDFTGGTLISFPNSYELAPEEIEAELKQKFPIAEISVKKGGGVLSVESQGKADEILALMAAEYGKEGTWTTLEVPLAETFKRQAPVVLVAAYIGMVIVVYVVFRSVLPSLLVAATAFLDMFEAVAFMTVLGVSLSLATVAALLMLIGYSVDDNILLTTRLLRRREEMRQRIRDGLKTGLTMTLTTLAALIALYVFTTSDVLRDIAIVLILGMSADIMNTWLFNAGAMRGYLEKKYRLLEERGRAR